MFFSANGDFFRGIWGNSEPRPAAGVELHSHGRSLARAGRAAAEAGASEAPGLKHGESGESSTKEQPPNKNTVEVG